MGKVKKAAKAHSEVGRRGGRRKTAAASNEERNLKKEMLAAMTVDCIYVNRFPTACQSDTKVLLPVKTKNRIFSAII